MDIKKFKQEIKNEKLEIPKMSEEVKSESKEIVKENKKAVLNGFFTVVLQICGLNKSMEHLYLHLFLL